MNKELNRAMINLLELTTGFFAGYSFRNRVEDEPEGDLKVIQMKDLSDNYALINSGLSSVSSDKINSKLFLKKHDVLFLAKGSNNYAVEYTHDFEKAIASAAFFVVRPDVDKVVPAYLAWYINQLPVQQYLKENMAGTYVPNINKSTIEGIMIALPSMAMQQKIVLIERLRKQEEALMNKIIDKRQVAVSAALLDIANK